jgi:hypothetical protein
MIFPPGFLEYLPVLLDHRDCPPDIAIGHAALGQNLERRDVDAGFAIAVDMNMGRLVIRRKDDEPHSLLSKDGDHSEIT